MMRSLRYVFILFYFILTIGNSAYGDVMDIVIPVAPKDKLKLKMSIDGILNNSSTNIGNVYVIAQDKSIIKNLNTKNKKNIIFISEKLFPFSKSDIETLINKRYPGFDHSSWYYQQLLKFYAFKVIKNLSKNFLILDSDFIFLKKIELLSQNNVATLAYGYPFKWLLNTNKYPNNFISRHIIYSSQLVPEWSATSKFTGIHHHMVFNQDILEHMFFLVENHHGKKLWQAFIDVADFNKWNAASEYVTYFHFAVYFYPELIKLRHLNTCDIIYDSSTDFKKINPILEKIKSKPEFDAVGCHGFSNLKSRLEKMDFIPKKSRKILLNQTPLCVLLFLEDGKLNFSGCQ
jgi:hypothetical protein